jgi:endonuclease/exonuclease/phosphatase family metal-dependent hydrolase
MKIISLNAWGGKQQAELKEYIHAHKASTDIFLLQEADEQIEMLRKSELEGWLTVAADQRLVGSRESFFNASVFKEGIVPVASGVLITSQQRVFGLWTELLYQGVTYFICNIHGMAMPGEKLDTEERLDQTRVTLDFLSGKPGIHIIMGDFNLFPETESILQIERAGYRNLIKEYNIETTRNEISWAKYSNKQLWADYCFVGPGIEVIDFQVPQNLVSDHLPMELTIKDKE